MVLLELLTGRVPIDINRPLGEHVLVSWVGIKIAFKCSNYIYVHIYIIYVNKILQALPRLSSREKVAEMVDPSLQGKYSKKDLIQVLIKFST